jgi:hypothetical protein
MRKQKTRKRIRKNHSRRTRHTKRSHRHKRQRQQGGNYAEDFTGKSIDGMPYTDKAVISMAGQPTMSVDEFERHAAYRDFQGEEQ